MVYDIFRGHLKLGKQGEKCCLFQEQGKKGSELGFTQGPIEITFTKQEWVSAHLRISAVYESGGIDYDIFKGTLNLAKQGENVSYFRNMVKRVPNLDLLGVRLKLLLQKKNGVGRTYV